jgi:hypothetical protein
MRGRNVDFQIRQMAEMYPDFQLVGATDALACWKGSICGADKAYRVSVTYYDAPMLFRDPFNHLDYPIVRVIDPLLKELERKGKPRLHIPHLFDNRWPHPAMCLLYPQEDPWSYRENVAEKVIPWAKNWLLAYEIWRATEVWPGVQHYHSLQATPRDQLGRSIENESNSPGRVIAPSVSLLLMAAASAGYFHSLSYEQWRKIFSMVRQLRTISTLLPAPLQAVSSPSDLLLGELRLKYLIATTKTANEFFRQQNGGKKQLAA